MDLRREAFIDDAIVFIGVAAAKAAVFAYLICWKDTCNYLEAFVFAWLYVSSFYEYKRHVLYLIWERKAKLSKR